MPKAAPEMPADFVEFIRGHTVKETRAHYGYGNTTIARLVAQAGMTEEIAARSAKFAKGKLPAPEDFAYHAAREINAELCERYGRSNSIIIRWRKIVGVRSPSPHAPKPVPENFAASAVGMTQSEAASHFGVSLETAKRWAAVSGIRFQKYQPVSRPSAHLSPRLRASFGQQIMAPRDTSMVGDAAHHLRRFFSNIYKAEILPPKDRAKLPDGGRGMFIVSGRGAMAASELIELAQKKGWNPDAWRTL